MSAPLGLEPSALPRAAPAVAGPAHAPQVRTGASSFANVLGKVLDAPAREPLRFSAHARQRMATRNLKLDESQTAGLAQALDQAAAKGARESLLVLDGMSLVVSVPNRTVITAVPHGEAGGAVFTHIDSAVVVPSNTATAKP